MTAATREEAQKQMQDFKETAGEVRDDLRQAANQAGRRVRRFIDSTTDTLFDAGDTVTSQVRRHPMQSSLIALGAGFLLGMLIRR
ncbi:MAG: DUF883 family protein [Pseudomonadota bacterium]|nr:DUF883 family protein [Pseudomonadota bacterium]